MSEYETYEFAKTLCDMVFSSFRSILVSDESLSSRQQLDCLDVWINSAAELTIVGKPVKVCI